MPKSLTAPSQVAMSHFGLETVLNPSNAQSSWVRSMDSTGRCAGSCTRCGPHSLFRGAKQAGPGREVRSLSLSLDLSARLAREAPLAVHPGFTCSRPETICPTGTSVQVRRCIRRKALCFSTKPSACSAVGLYRAPTGTSCSGGNAVLRRKARPACRE